MSSVEDVSELENLLDKLLDDLDEEFENNKKESQSEEQNQISETLENESEKIEDKEDNESKEDISDISSSYLTSIDIEPSFEDIETETKEEPEDTITQKQEDRLEKFMKGNLGVGEKESTEAPEKIEDPDVEYDKDTGKVTYVERKSVSIPLSPITVTDKRSLFTGFPVLKSIMWQYFSPSRSKSALSTISV